ncbi:MAG: type II toxin-antitoxin system HicB family antitoxin [Nitrospirae bacterium]|nr:type II toxin-antitoxin system HicB family antitoxin [Nitrospirota bacterium]
MKIPVLLEKNVEGGYTVTCPTLPGCISEGDTRAEALKNIREAMILYLRAVAKEEQLLRLEKDCRAEIVQIAL